MNIDQLRRIDFNLLLIFQAVMTHRQLTRAADDLDLTQSALSHALKRLREVVGEDLFVRRQFGMEPTEAARRLIGPVEAILATAQEALAPEGPFEPESTDRRFRVAAMTMEIGLFAVPLVERMATVAPGARVDFIGAGPDEAAALLEDGEADLFICHGTPAPERTTSTPILHTGYCVAARKGGTFRKKMTLKKYLAADHIHVMPHRGGTGRVDRAFSESGLQRRVTASVPDHITALVVAAAGTAAATVPTAVATPMAATLGLKLYPPPIDIRPVTIELVRHERRAHDAACSWLFEEIKAVAGAMNRVAV